MILLSTAYFPSVEYLHLFLSAPLVQIEACENFVKQTYRNRMHIASSNGLLALSVPLVNDGNKTPIRDKKISYAENWAAKHWRAIESAYSSSPYFEYFENEVKNVVFGEHDRLLDLNTKSLQVMLSLLRVKKEIVYTENYRSHIEGRDLRYTINPKETSTIQFPEYYQVFKEKTGFIANLSSLDLLFNEGMNSLNYLRTLTG